jgi:Ca-activated chloride channel family protein
VRLEVLTELVGEDCVYALVKLEPDASPLAERSPVNLALVLDRSSSMRGPRLNQAVRAAAEVVHRLDERDRLTIVQFDSAADIVFGPGRMDEKGRKRAFQVLAQTQAGAGTNISAGIRRGADALRGTFLRGAITRMLLLTDGQPSVGITDANKLGRLVSTEADEGVTLSTMGLGETFDDELLADLARLGRGGFYYLAGSADIAAAFGRELSGVFTIAARDTRLTIIPNKNVVSAEVLNRFPCRAVGDGLEVSMGDIAADLPKQALLRLELNEKDASRSCATLKLTYNHANGKPGDPHIAAVELDDDESNGAREVLLERLRLSSAIAVDLAWARRVSDDRETALAALSEIRRDIKDALDSDATHRESLSALLKDLDTAEKVVLDRAKRQAQSRRDLRERSHSVLLGISRVSKLPPPEED